MEKKIVCAQDDIEVVGGKVIINSDKLTSEIEGMNIVGDSISDEEGANGITISITIG